RRPVLVSYTLHLHDALPIFIVGHGIGSGSEKAPTIRVRRRRGQLPGPGFTAGAARQAQTVLEWATFTGDETDMTIDFNAAADLRSEEHTSELQSRENLVCRL